MTAAKDKFLTTQIVNYAIYTTAGVVYGLFGTEGAGTSGILLIPIVLFTIFLFLYNLAMTYLGQLIFKQPRLQIFTFLTPQIIGLIIFIFQLSRGKYIIEYDLDKVLWGFFVLTTILNVLTYYKMRRNEF